MYPILFEIGSFQIYTYGVILAIAFYCGVQGAVMLGTRRGFDEETILNLGIFSILCGLLGARTTYVWVYWDQFAATPIEVFKVWKGGLVFYGGLAGGVLGGVGYWLYKKQDLLPMCDIASISVCFGHAIGRLGCFFYGCCYGMLIPENSALSALGVHFPHLDGIRHPTQLYAFAGNLLISLFLYQVYRRFKIPGLTVAVYFYVYGTFRFLIELIRGDNRGHILGIEGLWTSQTIAIIGIIFGVVFHLYLLRRSRINS